MQEIQEILAEVCILSMLAVGLRQDTGSSTFARVTVDIALIVSEF